MRQSPKGRRLTVLTVGQADEGSFPLKRVMQIAVVTQCASSRTEAAEDSPMIREGDRNGAAPLVISAFCLFQGNSGFMLMA